MTSDELVEKYSSMNAAIATKLTNAAIDVEVQEKIKQADIVVGKTLKEVEKAANKGLKMYTLTPELATQCNQYAIDTFRNLGYTPIVDYSSTRSSNSNHLGTTIKLQWGALSK